MANEIHPPLHPTCHHYINFIKLNLKNPLPNPQKRFVWHFNRANEKAIYDSSKRFDWRQQLDDLSAKDSVNYFDEKLLNICKNFIPLEDKMFIPRDPPWITKTFKIFYNNYKRKLKDLPIEVVRLNKRSTWIL